MDKLLDRLYIPIEIVPKLDNMDMTFKYTLNSGKCDTPKNTSYIYGVTQMQLIC